MEGVALEVAALKGSEVGQEERREGSPGKGGLERSCLGFGNPARCRPSRPGQPPPAPAPGFAALRPPPEPQPRGPQRPARHGRRG